MSWSWNDKNDYKYTGSDQLPEPLVFSTCTLSYSYVGPVDCRFNSGLKQFPLKKIEKIILEKEMQNLVSDGHLETGAWGGSCYFSVNVRPTYRTGLTPDFPPGGDVQTILSSRCIGASSSLKLGLKLFQEYWLKSVVKISVLERSELLWWDWLWKVADHLTAGTV